MQQLRTSYHEKPINIIPIDNETTNMMVALHHCYTDDEVVSVSVEDIARRRCEKVDISTKLGDSLTAK
jgi:hypothetical protein